MPMSVKARKTIPWLQSLYTTKFLRVTVVHSHGIREGCPAMCIDQNTDAISRRRSGSEEAVSRKVKRREPVAISYVTLAS